MNDWSASLHDSLDNKYYKVWCIFRKFNKHNTKYLNRNLYYSQVLKYDKTINSHKGNKWHLEVSSWFYVQILDI